MSRAEVVVKALSGRGINPFYPTEESISIGDIAHSLSMQCRFNGHIRNFYSVAEHSIKVSELLEDRGLDSLVQLYGLLHDASEAYIADLPKPFKDMLSEYITVEHVLQKAIETKLIGPRSIESTERALIDVIDSDMCLHESKEFGGPLDWDSNLFQVKFTEPLDPREAKMAFLDRYFKLIEEVYHGQN